MLTVGYAVITGYRMFRICFFFSSCLWESIPHPGEAPGTQASWFSMHSVSHRSSEVLTASPKAVGTGCGLGAADP